MHDTSLHPVEIRYSITFKFKIYEHVFWPNENFITAYKRIISVLELFFPYFRRGAV